MLLHLKGGGLKRVPVTHACYHAMRYPLLMPNADSGWSLKYKAKSLRVSQRISMLNFSVHRMMIRQEGTKARHFEDEKEAPEYLPILHHGRRLFQTYIVDEAVRIEDDALRWFHFHQKEIRADVYQGLEDAISADDIEHAGRRKVLPSSFSGGPRSRNQHYLDGLAAMVNLGIPSLFLTFTCNPKWSDKQDDLFSGQQAYDRPDLCARVFKMKLDHLMWKILREDVFGKVIAWNITVEFQKRGLPHAHILVTFTSSDRPKCADDYDRFISAEIPSQENVRLRKLVLKHMIHGPCGDHNPNSPCMKDSICSKSFPKAFADFTKDNESMTHPEYRRLSPSKGGNQAILKPGTAREQVVDNRWVVPYNPYLLLELEAHLNIEIVTTTGCMKYLYKYVNKGDDRTSVAIQKDIASSQAQAHSSANNAPEQPQVIDEIANYQSGRYVSAPQGVWKILNFKIQDHQPPVDRLPVHLKNQQWLQFDPLLEGGAQRALERYKKTKLTEYFSLTMHEEKEPLNEKQLEHGPPASDLRYVDIPKYYAWHAKNQKWQRRKRFREWPPISRVYTVHPNQGERYFLRRLLHHVPGIKSFEHLKCWNGTSFLNEPFATYKAVCVEMGLLEDDGEWETCLLEASVSETASDMRRLFCSLLNQGHVQDPTALWEFAKNHLCDDILHDYRTVQNDPSISVNTEIEYEVLRKISSILLQMDPRKNLASFGLPEPPEEEKQPDARWLHKVKAPLAYNTTEQRTAAEESRDKLLPEQAVLFNAVMKAVQEFTSNSILMERRA